MGPLRCVLLLLPLAGVRCAVRSAFGLSPMVRLAKTPVSARASTPRLDVRNSLEAAPPPDDEDDADEEELLRLETGRQKIEQIFARNETIDPRMSATQRLLQQLFPSSQFVGGKGELPQKFVFVDEVTCIGCTHCRFVAPNTFMLEDDYGRARVFQQGGDNQELIDEAVECCPVECIHQVSHTELVRLEEHREEQLFGMQAKYWKSRLVGPEIGIPRVPNWWEPLMDSAQPAWAGMIQGEQSLSSLGFLDGPKPEEVKLDQWGHPVPQDDAVPAEGDGQPVAEECDVSDIEVCDLVDCEDPDVASLAAQLEESLRMDSAELCDLVDCGDATEACKDLSTPDVTDPISQFLVGAFNSSSVDVDDAA